jgi:hypothetical protein
VRASIADAWRHIIITRRHVTQSRHLLQASKESLPLRAEGAKKSSSNDPQ